MWNIERLRSVIEVLPRMSAEDLAMLQVAALNEPQKTSYDAKVLEGTSKKELDGELVAQFLRNVRQKSSRLAKVSDDDRLLEIVNVTDSRGQLRLAGLYALGFMPTATYPSLTATAGIRLERDGSGARARNIQDFEGPIPLLLEDAVKWVRQNTSEDRVYAADGHMEKRPEFPMSAIRELLANAFVHRDLSPQTVDMGKRVEIRLLHDRLIIKNPGGLHGVSQDQLGSSNLVKAAVNQRLYEIAKNLETPDGRAVIEGEGGGIPEVLYAMRAAGKPDPRFLDNGVEFTVILMRANRYSDDDLDWLSSFPGDFSWIQREILVGLHRGESWSRNHARKEFHQTREQEITRAISDLEDRRIIDDIEGELVIVGESVRPGTASARKQSTKNSDARDNAYISSLGKNTGVVYEAISSGDQQVADIIASTGLSRNQVRYALDQLVDAREISMEGGRGIRETRYYVKR